MTVAKSQAENVIPWRIINAYIAGQTIFASIGCGIYSSTDAGQTFRHLKDFFGATHGLRSIFVSGGSLFVSPAGPQLSDSEKGLWRSRDGGSSWQRVFSLAGQENPVSIWAIAADDEGRLFVGVYTLAPNTRLANIYRSTDGGEHWELSYSDSTGRHVHAIAVDRRTNAIYASIGDNFSIWKTKHIVKSVDHGDSWQEILSELPQVAPIVATPAARILGSDYPGITQIYRTTDDENYSVVMSDDSNLLFFWIRRDETDGTLLAGGMTADESPVQVKIYRSVDDGISWLPLRTFGASSKSDGSAFASNFSQSKLVVQIREGGVLRNALMLDPNE